MAPTRRPHRTLRRLIPVVLLAPVLAMSATTPAAGGESRSQPRAAAVVREARPVPAPSADALTRPGVRTLLERGYLVPDEEAYAAGKARAAAQARARSAPARGRAAADGPEALVTWQGVFDPRGTPSDSTGAIGPRRYVEMINVRFGIYERDGTRLSSGDLSALTGFGPRALLTDPQVIWDPDTERFYYVVLDVDFNGIDYAFGFSRGPAPNDAGDWCRYSLSYGYDDPARGTFRIPDQPHMGDTRNFLLFGANTFDITFEPFYVGADVQWVTKPQGPGCPAGTSFRTGLQRDLRMPSGEKVFTPVAANQMDPSTEGWVVSARFVPRGSARALGLFRVTRNASGGAVIQRTGRAVDVDAYFFPPTAPQRGTTAELDTLDGRLLQAVSAVDPARGEVGLWTAHSVEGGAGTEVRWYEIEVDRARLFQSGEITDPDLYAFNAAISPDRIVREGVRKFGQSMVVGFNTSSSDTFVAIQMVSKVRDEPQSGFVLIKRSPGPEKDFSCNPVCRWGDYSGATPDPAANPNFETGRVWLTNMWARPPGPQTMDWRTWNWAAKP